MKKIMFNDKYGLTEAVLEGRKTQTRRIAYDGYIENPTQGYGLEGNEKDHCFLLDGCRQVAKSTYKVGEEVAIAQSYETIYKESSDEEFRKLHKACLDATKGWNNKMFVASAIMLHRIKITNVRIEKLQDISDEDCLKEGIERCCTQICHENYCIRDCGDCYSSPREAFASLIDKVSGKGTWESNPYVFVYDFELIK